MWRSDCVHVADAVVDGAVVRSLPGRRDEPARDEDRLGDQAEPRPSPHSGAPPRRSGRQVDVCSIEVSRAEEVIVMLLRGC